jgi:hypothetical protein
VEAANGERAGGGRSNLAFGGHGKWICLFVITKLSSTVFRSVYLLHERIVLTL